MASESVIQQVNYAYKLEEISRGFDATEKQLNTAIRRACGKLARWMKAQALRELAQETGIKPSKLKSRVRSASKTKEGLPVGRVWIGGSSVSFRSLGPKKAKGGAKAGGIFKKNAFQVNHRNEQWFQRVGSDRLPIKKITVDIMAPAMRVIRADIAPEAEKKFFEIFEREIRWETTRNLT
ncbi:hypothetical protein [Halodesulfovibrio aestuarii]|uniref:Phage tail protein n=1 Tax=Halodesulfovibrio aestuarii TaxID=126333 RepID=A0ABV4JTY4_9BACT